MDSPQSAPQPTSADPVRRSRARIIATVLLALLVIWFVMAYVIIPAGWETYAHHHPSFEDIPNITYTGDDHPGDPLNVSLIGTEDQVKTIMKAASWYPADPLGLRSDLRIGVDTVLEKPYDEAPVSKLFLFGRKEDMAFEKPVGDDPKKRNHVRYWRTEKKNPDDDRPVWIGSASFDARVGLSDTTGQITHHISPDVDAERDLLFKDLEQTGDLSETYFIDGFHKVLSGKNGGGDPWHTDGRLEVGVIKP